MPKLSNFFKNILKKKIFWIILIVVVAAGGYIWSKKAQESAVNYVTEDAKIGDVRQTVSVTGIVTASDKINLNFKAAGNLSDIFISEGDEVKKGDLLAKLDAKSAEIQVQQSEANLSAAKANLSKLLAGASQEDILVSQESVNNAKISYDNAKRDYDAMKTKLDKDIETYEEAVSSAEVALADSQKNLANAGTTYTQNVINAKNSAITSVETNLLMGDIVLNNINYNLSILVGISTNQQNVRDAETYRALAASESAETKIILSAAKSSGETSDIYQALRESISALNKVLNSLAYLTQAVSSAAASNPSQLTIIESVKTGVKADQASITNAISAVQSSEQSLLNAENSYQSQTDNYQAAVNTATNNLLSARTSLSAALANKDVQLAQSKAAVDNALGSYNLAKAQYNYKIAPPRSADIAYYQSQVAQAEAALELAKNQLGEYTLTAPVDGTIAFVNYTPGEQVNAAQTVVSMIGKNKFYIEADIPESDITKISLGNTAEVTLDAYSDELKFDGRVILIYPAESVVQDVVYYKVRVEMDTAQYVIKSGMTANCDILTAEKNNVLLMPYRALQEKDGRRFVRVVSDGKVVEKNVETGLRGDEGEIEVISGLKAGEKVVVFEKNNAK